MVTLPAHWKVYIDWANDGAFSGNDDISADVRSIAWSRGATRQFGSAEPGTCTIEVQNRSDKYLDSNGSSPLAGNIRVGRPAWLAANYNGVDYPIFAGVIKAVDPRGSYLPTERRATIVLQEISGTWRRRRVDIAPTATVYDGVAVSDLRSMVLGQLGVPSQNVALGIEDSMLLINHPVSFTDANGNQVEFIAGISGDALSVMNEFDAMLGRWWIRPSTQALRWQVASQARNANTDSPPDFIMIYGTDYDELDGYTVTDEGVVNEQTVAPRDDPLNGPQEYTATDVASQNLYGPIVGPDISSDLLPGLSDAEGVAKYMVWRFGSARQRPVLRMQQQRRLPDALAADLFDVVSVTDPRYYLTSRRTEIVGISGRWQGTVLEVDWTLQEVPAAATVVTIGRDGLGSAAVLAR